MTGAPTLPDESARLMALAYYGILDTPREPQFDRIARLAAAILKTPVAVINFVDQFRQWGKASVGVGDTTAPRADSFCAWTIQQDQPLVVPNAHLDPRFAQNPMVTGEPHVHMYAGAPLVMPSGHRIGTLCVTDTQPHPLTPQDLQALQDLADIVVTELELRAYQQRLTLSLDAQREHSAELQRSLAQSQALDGISQLLSLDLEPQDALLAAAALLGEAMHSDVTGLLVIHGDEGALSVGHLHPRVQPEQRAALEGDELFRLLRPHLPGTERPTLLDDAQALGLPGPTDLQALAWAPVGMDADQTLWLVAARLNGHPQGGWRAAERSLFEAAARSLRASLDHRQARAWARRDVLTGVLNRRALEQDLAQPSAVPFMLVMADVDGLKAVNDVGGHAQGDKLLRVFAATLAAEVGSAGQVYRYGGDEFVVLTAPTNEELLLDQVDTAVLAARQLAPQAGASVGVAHSQEGEPQTLLRLADERMYAVKRRRVALRQSGELTS
ncbi:sensor domain-containing diguanylate cyclase [Deinococcus sp. HMF7604]|uniref:sensor domain-containing diguanylate cyclase n=1 Tax=Deinococcus betulae TaxID=2873312 RepID=UPI001CCF502C|nr:sensor domain-containing diguanylate cyclase [Deinococcus betulae]MBZ9751554.1 sensor domain-containing diguanylate cyclase [Deinococcus betulae]